jgi:hypothetical protein
MVNIGVFYSKNNSPWQKLPDISAFLSEKQLVPNVGDRVTAIGDDHKVMGITADDFANCVTVKEKVFHHSGHDIALVCDYIPF